jgi:hypothetical protein
MSTLRVDNLQGQTTGTNRYVVQVVSETIDTQLAGSVGSAGTYIDTGVTASITPTSVNNKILVSFVFGGAGSNASGDLLFRLMRGSSNIAQGASGTYISTAAIRSLNAEVSCTPCFIHLDYPSTTSATTYKVQGSLTGSGTLAINRRQSDTTFGTASNITLMEIAQ